MAAVAAAGPARDRCALVTGAARGLGAAVAIRLAARGVAVALADRDGPGMAGTSRACAAAGRAATPFELDLMEPEAPERLVSDASRALGGLDIVINCAAAAPAEPFLEMTARAWDSALAVNVRALALLMAAAGRVMGAQDPPGGRIINATSAAARMALPNYAAYAATKAAVDSLTRSAAVALAKQGVRVNSLSPGMMDTPLQQETEALFARYEGREDLAAFQRERTARIPLGRRTDPEEMAQVLEWMALDAPSYMTAARLNVTGGLDRD